MVKKVEGRSANVGAVEARQADGDQAGVKGQKSRAIQPEIAKITKADIARFGGGEVKERPARVRFAPSPTGHLHIGSARTALMNYLFARKMGGSFLLRIEDTDQARSKPEYTEAILEGLKYLGMKWDEEPIFQSERTEIYKQKVQQLVDAGKAYKDPSGAVFFKMPEEGVLTVHDRVKGTVQINVGNADGNSDYVLQRSDGAPTFLLANVVDDGEQRITHVLRGDDHLSNAARQIPLFRALGYDVPEFYHMPLIHGDPTTDENGKTVPGGKLSKRHGATSVIEYEAQGFEPRVITNHFARMGMSYGTDETLSLDELAQRFDPLRMSKSPSVLGMAQLEGRMQHHIAREKVPALVKEMERRLADEEGLKAHLEDPGTETRPGFFDRTAVTADEARQALEGAGRPQLEALADGARSRAKSYGEMIDMLAFFRARPTYVAAEKEVYAGASAKKLMKKLLERLDALPAAAWTLEGLDAAIGAFHKEAKVGPGAYGETLRWMLTGVKDGLPVHHTLAIIGREESLQRLGEVIG